MKRIVVILLCSLYGMVGIGAQEAMTPIDMQCEHLVNPLEMCIRDRLVCFLARIILTELQSASNGRNRKINNENNEVYYQRNRRFLLTSEL